jgi:hypothetical protein
MNFLSTKKTACSTVMGTTKHCMRVFIFGVILTLLFLALSLSWLAARLMELTGEAPYEL